MSRMESSVDPVDGRTKDILDAVKRNFGRVPLGVRVLANSAAALAAWWDFERALDTGSLPRSLREQIAILTSSQNQCQYCVSAHTSAAMSFGVSPHDARSAQQGQATEAETAAALAFALDALQNRGDVSEAALVAARIAGWSDSQLLEILAVVAINSFNNYYTRFVQPPLDFPPVELSGTSRGVSQGLVEQSDSYHLHS